MVANDDRPPAAPAAMQLPPSACSADTALVLGRGWERDRTASEQCASSESLAKTAEMQASAQLCALLPGLSRDQRVSRTQLRIWIERSSPPAIHRHSAENREQQQPVPAEREVVRFESCGRNPSGLLRSRCCQGQPGNSKPETAGTLELVRRRRRGSSNLRVRFQIIGNA